MFISKEEIIAAIRQCADTLGRCPTLADLKAQQSIGLRPILRCFSTYTEALRQAGLEPQGPGHRVSLEELFLDWMQLARRLAKIPSAAEYRTHSRHSVRPLLSRFGAWAAVPGGLLQFAQEQGAEIAAEWQDVIEIIHAHAHAHAHQSRQNQRNQRNQRHQRNRPGHRQPSLLLAGRPVYGSPIHAGPLAHAPTNELGVVYLFGALADQLGFMVMRIQNEFPDCEAMRNSGHDRWQRLRLEFEFESRNFLAHRHDPEGCDLVVCWTHNWPECPDNLEVLELSSILRQAREDRLPVR